MNILAFGASSSRHSINKVLATYAANQVADATVTILDLNYYDMPIYNQDREVEFGIPDLVQGFLSEIAKADVIIISFAEHNGSYTAAYKNVFDWASRVSQKVFAGKKMVLLATSPGPGGAQNVLAQASASMPHFGGEVVGSLSVPSFHDNVQEGELSNEALKKSLQEILSLI
ncbi:NADPH-dependent FMN reductase [Marinomonas epiphytica]